MLDNRYNNGTGARVGLIQSALTSLVINTTNTTTNTTTNIVVVTTTRLVVVLALLLVVAVSVLLLQLSPLPLLLSTCTNTEYRDSSHNQKYERLISYEWVRHYGISA